MIRRKKRKLSKKEEKALKKQPFFSNNEINSTNDIKKDDKIDNINKEKVEIPNIVTVRELAELLDIPVTKIISELIKNGVMASINESIDFITASIIADDLGYEAEQQKVTDEPIKELSAEDKKKLKQRPPVVVVLGHVDHGKTTLLDAIRKTNVVKGESGGITQHIGAHQVNWKDKDNNYRKITFLDTPGHEAFSAMRAHGANITDIAILVVAADDGVKPQTKEAISHARSADIPILVAINKIDKPESDPEKVKRELSDLGLVPEEWGGDTVMIPVSAKNNKNINTLLDMLLVIADMKDYQTIFDSSAKGVVIESHMQSGVGPIATVLVQSGTLKISNYILMNTTFGKIRLMEDYLGKRIKEAGPSMPAKIAGLKDVPNFGEIFEVVTDEKTARNKIASKSIKHAKFGLAEVSKDAEAGKLKELNIILKADTQGSIEAIKTSLESLKVGEIKINVISDTVGNISESDINMAVATKSIVVGFRVTIPSIVRKLSDEKGIKITLYDIIYNLIDDIEAALKGMIKPVFIEEIIGKFEVIKTFHSTKNHKIIGGKVINGKIVKGSSAHIYHSGEICGEGKISTLKKEKNPVEEVTKGFECGLGVDTENNIKTGDIIESYQMIEKIKNK